MTIGDKLLITSRACLGSITGSTDKGDIFQIFLHTAKGDMEGLAANQQGSGKGSSYQAKGGQYYLQVNAIGSWDIHVVQIGGESLNAEKPRNNSKVTSSINLLQRDGVFLLSDNGIIKDTRTGLEWKADPDEETTWNGANVWAQSLVLDGRGWRLPTVGELRTLFKKGLGKNNMSQLLNEDRPFVWSGETDGSSKAVVVLYVDGSTGSMDKDSNIMKRAFAVRSPGDNSDLVGTLFVETVPENAKFRLLGVVPEFHQGIKLDPGRYQIEVTASGYIPQKQWVFIPAKENTKFIIRLEKNVTRKLKTFTNSLGMMFAKIPAGNFMMGLGITPSKAKNRYGDNSGHINESRLKYELSQHRVTISKPFYLQTTEVTVGQWREFINDSGYQVGWALEINKKNWKFEEKEGKNWDNPGFEQSENSPVTCVSWEDAQEFISWLNKKEGKTYRLPTEAEWEYAARAGTTSVFYTGDCLYTDQANFNGDFLTNLCGKGFYRRRTTEVGKFAPNPWGLHDVYGNVWEICQDYWKKGYSSDSVVDPKGPSSGIYRVVRGGSFGNGLFSCRSASRSITKQKDRSDNSGIRLAMDP